MRTIGLAIVVAMACGCHHGLRTRLAPSGPSETRTPEREAVPVSKAAELAVQAEREPAGDVAPRQEVSEESVPRDVTAVVQQVNGQLLDAFFDYDRAALTSAAIAALREDAALLSPILKEFPQVQVTVEGHCDERGSAEYNLGLGDDRARQAMDMLARFGVAGQRTQAISYGKERPQCTEANESCRQRNRRAHLVIRAAGATE